MVYYKVMLPNYDLIEISVIVDVWSCGFPLPVLSCSLFLANLCQHKNKIRFIKCFCEKLLNTRSHRHLNLYFPLIDSDNGFLNMFYFKQTCKII